LPTKNFIDDNYDVSVGYGTIVLTDWNDGHNHLYLYSYDQANSLLATAKLERQLTKGDFEVQEILRVDHGARLIDYSSNEGNLLERQLWQVSFDGERKLLSDRRGRSRGKLCSCRRRICR
jgi:dipeptidyl-peptidase-4